MAKHYLYVEDDRSSRLVMQMLMDNVVQISTYTIFEDSSDFLTRLKALPAQPDIILLDIHLTPLDGFQLLDIIRAEPGYAETRVFALTASVMNEEVERLRRSGFDGAIGKPLDALAFPDIIERLEQGQPVWTIT